ncbi:hypothetical protein [Nocardia sp. NBC_01329]|uniref:hypothetical protein n=1 Tax=Nocardia sp. NBC_01329 TaxID=2903594 RepID=UPI002E0E30F5|nr:hypothetical protein OG405_10530 [Nocardia sp. NBC_01329]
MTDALHFLDTPECGAVAILTGVLAGESDRDIRVRVADGTWTFRRGDVLAVRSLDERTTDREVRVEIRLGSTADFTRSLRIDVVERPMTLAAPPSEACGDPQLHRLTESWAQRLDLADTPEFPATFTCAQTMSHNTSDDGIHSDSFD